MQYTLLQQSNGDYYLALRNNVSVYQVATCLDFQNGLWTKSMPGSDIYPQNVPVTLICSDDRTFAVYAPNDLRRRQANQRLHHFKHSSFDHVRIAAERIVDQEGATSSGCGFKLLLRGPDRPRKPSSRL